MRRKTTAGQEVSMVREIELSDDDREAMITKGKLIMNKLEEVYPVAPKGFLDHSDPFTLLVAVLLSAQALDIKVNEATPELFRLGGTPKKMSELGVETIQDLIKTIGIYRQKAKNIAALSEILCKEHDGEVPGTFEELERLPGVGHKTASVVMMQAFGKPAFPVDTHIHRLACRWGCGDAKSVEKTEQSLKMWFPDPKTWGDLHVRIILFGREHCPARKHNMDKCPVCSFAATDEARQANKASPQKFVAASKHKNPYSIREVSDSGLEEEDDFAFEEEGKRGSKLPRNRGQGVSTDRSSAVGSRTSVRKAQSAQSTFLEEEQVEEGQVKSYVEVAVKPTRKRSRKKKEEAKKVDIELRTDDAKLGSKDERKPATRGKRGGASVQKENASVKSKKLKQQEVEVQNGEGIRKSRRIRSKREKLE